jgi:carbonic anhydrase
LILVVWAVLFAPVLEGALSFEYAGPLGPRHWGQIAPEWRLCGTGREQSPIDFGPFTLAGRRYGTLAASYGASQGDIVNNGHTIQVNVKGGNVLVLGQARYELAQFHFHTPSEHTFGGRGYDMELHLVHATPQGNLAVVGVFLQRGTSSGALDSIFEHLPAKVDVREPLRELFDPGAFLPRNKTHYRYAGSLTTPACSEGVQWIVMATPMTVSDEHMAEFAERIPFNARPVQRVFR